MPEAEIKRWLEFVIDEIKDITDKPEWIEERGTLDLVGNYALWSCDSMFLHQVPVNLAFESQLFQAFTLLLIARKGRTTNAVPSDHVCNFIISMVSCAFHTGTTTLSWSKKPAFRKLHKTGILEQVLRCSTRVTARDKRTTEPTLEKLLDELQSCPHFHMHLKTGTPCGDTLRAILEGPDEHLDIIVSNRLSAIVKIADLTIDVCYNCGASADSLQCLLQECSCCEKALYCSRMCQKADWRPHHKKICVSIEAPSAIREANAVERLVNNYFNAHRDTILIQMKEACITESVTANEMVVEVDFVAREDESIPGILHDPPLFKIASRQAYIDGTERPRFLI
ncbi:unnamed protein product [Cylindrotheca closterium]|uniref:MYND-type domain-containing protein n=1 Tax=Cylindrotheca closterium TaxID=2856 RepID=A0AAD2JJ69_9STRA|nr:unnamed protein product [Cylindrotheca closterium]